MLHSIVWTSLPSLCSEPITTTSSTNTHAQLVPAGRNVHLYFILQLVFAQCKAVLYKRLTLQSHKLTWNFLQSAPVLLWMSMIRYGFEDWKLLTELRTHIKDDDVLIDEKRRYDAFFNTRLEGLLRRFGIDTVIISGVMTNLCCETTARSAFIHDFSHFP